MSKGSTAREAERLTAVYQGYHHSQRTQAQWSHANPGNRAIYQERQRALAALLQSRGLLPLAGSTVLEIGCASGEILMSLPRLGARPEQLHGIDLVAERIAIARARYPGVDFQVGNAESLAFEDASFDFIVMFTVFSSILDATMARHVAAEAWRVLKPGGAVIWYDFRVGNPGNRSVRGMTKRDIASLFPDCAMDLRSLTLLPPLARRFGRATAVLYPLLARVPMLRTHYLGLLFKQERIG
jgi:ubiquinone/menaquinone biosynthesis C-methylase UbiE